LLESQSALLGLLEDAVEGEPLEVPLQPGDRVVIYTDGFIESFNPQEVHQNWLAGMWISS